MERDINRDRERVERVLGNPCWAVCSTEGQPLTAENSAMLADVHECIKALPYYIDGHEYQQRMLGISGELMARVVCVNRPAHCDPANGPELTECRKCVNDYLEKKAKESELRPAVLWFAQEMEKQLRVHDAIKGERGWDNLTANEIDRQLRSEYRELQDALTFLPINWAGVIHESADLGNLCMMLADHAKARLALSQTFHAKRG